MIQLGLIHGSLWCYLSVRYHQNPRFGVHRGLFRQFLSRSFVNRGKEGRSYTAPTPFNSAYTGTWAL